MKLLMYVIAILLAVSFVSATVSVTTVQLTDNSGNDINVDLAVDSHDYVHRVYERDSKIYYSNSEDNIEHYVADGTNPSVAVGPNDVPQIVFLNNGYWNFAKLSGSTWSITADINSANWVDIAVDTNNKAHVVFSGNYDGGGYNDIVYSNNINGQFESTEIADGQYGYGSGSYYHNPSIALDSNNDYYIALVSQLWGGRASWSADYATVLTNSARGSISSSEYPYNSVSMNRNSIAIDDLDNVHILFTYGTIYHVNVYPLWTQASIASGSNPAIDAKDKVAVVYDADGSVYYTEDTGSGFSTPIVYGAGYDSAVALGSKFVDYSGWDGSDYEIYEYNEGGSGGHEVPEFGLIAGCIAMIGVAGIIAIRRRK